MPVIILKVSKQNKLANKDTNVSPELLFPFSINIIECYGDVIRVCNVFSHNDANCRKYDL